MAKKRILYIEDNSQNKRLVNKVLTARGYEVLEASDGILGIEMAMREKPDLILMDVNLPGMDGMETTARLKQSTISKTFVIALTANAMRGDRERIMAAGCDEYLQKPLSNKLLVETIERFIGPPEASQVTVPEVMTSALPVVLATAPAETLAATTQAQTSQTSEPTASQSVPPDSSKSQAMLKRTALIAKTNRVPSTRS